MATQNGEPPSQSAAGPSESRGSQDSDVPDVQEFPEGEGVGRETDNGISDPKVDALQDLIQDLERSVQELERDEKSLETVLPNILEQFQADLEASLDRAEEGVEKMGDQLSEPIRAVLRALEDDLQETAQHIESRVENLTGEGLKRYRQIAAVKGEVEAVCRDLEEAAETFRKSVEEVKSLKGQLQSEVESAHATASILEGAALERDIDKLNETFENHIKEVVSVGQNIQEKTTSRVESHFNEVCNRLDERRTKLTKRMDSAQKMMEGKISEMKAIKAKVEELESNIDDHMGELVAQTKAITLRRAFIILAASFVGTGTAIVLGHLVI
jgi:hypothetical protein